MYIRAKPDDDLIENNCSSYHINHIIETNSTGILCINGPEKINTPKLLVNFEYIFTLHMIL